MTEREIRTLLDMIDSGKDVRKSLITLKEEMRDPVSYDRICSLPDNRKQVIIRQLYGDDPKARKNAAVIIGELKDPGYMRDLFEAYRSEKTLFVRPAYLKALSGYDCSALAEEMKEQEKKLLKEISLAEAENRKHLYEELTALRSLLHRYSDPKRHIFRLKQQPDEIVLITNREQRDVTAALITQGTIRRLAGGLRIKGGDLNELLKIRTWSEMLFPIPGIDILQDLQ